MSLPALVESLPKLAFLDLERAAELHISNKNGKTKLKNSGLPKAFITWRKYKSKNIRYKGQKL